PSVFSSRWISSGSASPPGKCKRCFLPLVPNKISATLHDLSLTHYSRWHGNSAMCYDIKLFISILKAYPSRFLVRMGTRSLLAGKSVREKLGKYTSGAWNAHQLEMRREILFGKEFLSLLPCISCCEAKSGGRAKH